MRSRILVALILALLAIRSSLCRGDDESAAQWGPFTGTVVDASTGQPIPGALFAVVWFEGSEMFIPMPGHKERFFDARVAVADERGRFEIPRRQRAFFAPRPDVGCASPGYKDQTIHPQGGPITVELRPLTEKERQADGWPVNNLSLIPTEKWNDFERPINQRRAEMGLPAICFGGIFLCEWTMEDSWFTGRFDPQADSKWGGQSGIRKHKVNNTRVFPVPDSRADEAIARLEKSPIVPLSDEEAEYLLPGSAKLDPDAMLRAAAEGASKSAQSWERDAAEWQKRATTQEGEGERKSRNEYVARCQDGAQVDRQVAQHALGLLGKLKPYLVRGVVLNEASAARFVAPQPAPRFVVYLDGTELWIKNPLRQTDLSHRRPMKRRPVVTFLERAPTQVHVLMDVSEPEWYAAKNPAQ